MATAKFPEFHENEEDWTIYSERLEQHFAANNITKGEQKVGILISGVGTTTYQLLRNLCFPDLPKTKTYDELNAMLSKQYSPQINIWRERKKFYEAKQEQQQSIAEWYASIRSLAINCRFGDSLTLILRDKFVSGLQPGEIFDRLCEESETEGMERMQQVALQKENQKYNVSNGDTGRNFNFVRKAGKPVKPHHHTERRHTGNYAHRQNYQKKKTKIHITPNPSSNLTATSKQTCNICGAMHRGECKYKDYNCNVCKRRGHLSRVCPKKEFNFMNLQQAETDQGNVEPILDFNNELAMFSVDYQSKVSSADDFKVHVDIDNKPFVMEIDSGAAMSAVNSSTYFNNFACKYKLNRDNTILKAYNGSIFSPLGYFVCKVNFNCKCHEIKFYVIENGGPNILGRDFLTKFKVCFKMVNTVESMEKVKHIIDEFPEVFSNKLGTFKYAKNHLN